MKQLYVILLLFSLTSCATEKMNFSPVALFGNSKSDENGTSRVGDLVMINIRENVNASDISGLISSFPKFKNDGINYEIGQLKTSLQNYLYAVEAGNKKGRERSIKKFENSYKKIQKNKKYLNADENDVVSRYLTRLKTNVSIIEDLIDGKTIN